MLKRLGFCVGGLLLCTGAIAVDGVPIASAQTPPAAAFDSGQSTIVEETLTTAHPTDPDGRFYAIYPLAGQAGATVQIELISDDFDPVLALYDANGQNLAQNNNGGEGTNAKLIETLPTDGVYAIAVQTHAPNQLGAYRLVAQPASPADVAALAQARQLDAQVAQALYQTHDYAAAIPLATTSLALRHRLFGDDHFYTVLSLTYLGLLHQELQQYAEAAPLLQRVLVGTEQELGATHISVAIALDNLAGVYVAMGQYALAVPLRERAVRVREQILGAEHPDTATSLSALGEVYFTLGRYDAVEPLFTQALAIREQALGPEHHQTAASLNNLGVLYQALGRYTEAEPLLQRALAIQEGQSRPHETTIAFGSVQSTIAPIVDNLARLYQVTGRPTAAEALFQKALALREQTFGADHPEVGQGLNSLAAFYQTVGRFTEAETLYQRAIAINAQAFGAEHPHHLASLHNLATLYIQRGRYGDARPLFERTVALRQQTLGEEHPLVALGTNLLAVVAWLQGQTPTAIALFTQGFDIEEQNLDRLLAIGSERQKTAYFETIAGSTDVIISFHQQAALDNVAAGRLALTTLLRRKGRILDAITDNQDTLRQNLTPANQRLRDRLQARRSELTTAIFNPPQPTTSAYRDRVAQLKGEIDHLEAQLARASIAFRVQHTPVELETIQAAIPDDAVLIEFLEYQPFDPGSFQRGASRYVAYLLTAQGDPQWVDLGPAEALHQKIRAFKRRLQSTTTQVESRFFPSAQELYGALMAPIAAKLGTNTQHLLIAPDSELNLIPFAALVNPEGQYLIEQYQITYLTSGRDLLRYQHTAPSQTHPLILANINYDAPDKGAIALENAPTPNPHRRSADLRGQVTPLANTAAEGTKIAQLLANATLLTQNAATESAIKQVKGPQILHIATHGFFLQLEQVAPAALTAQFLLNDDALNRPEPPAQENPLLRSGLALAGYNQRNSGREDGVLTALEVAGLNLVGTQLTVLSACETGLGEVANGEGVYGLRRALVIAGSESQLISLWQVDDAATQALMVQYYQALQAGQGRSAALRQVQLAMLQNTTANYTAPFFWAAFIPSGNWQPLRESVP